MLILAGVSIAMLSGDNGLIKQAQNASDEWEIAQDREQLELAKQTEIAKGKGYINVDDYFQRLEDEGIVNDKDADIVDNGDGSYDVTTGNGNTFEVTPIPDKENAEELGCSSFYKINRVYIERASRERVGRRTGRESGNLLRL